VAHLLPIFLLLAAAPNLDVQGHRGARALRPENTLPAFEHAIAVGADVLELDLAVTKDDRLVVTHDLTLNPDICKGAKGERIRELTLAELQKFDCGALKNPRFPKQTPISGTRIPTLEAVLDLVAKQRGSLRLNIEMKSVPALAELTPPPDQFAALVIGVLETKRMSDRAVLQSFDHRTLVEAKKRRKDIPIAALIEGTALDFVAVARSLNAEIISPEHLFLTREAVAALHAAKIRVIPWTANTAEDWDRLIAFGVDGIITDDPEALIAHLKAKGLRN
jgi:glycerophosphoryl diester phosphodiesterase